MPKRRAPYARIAITLPRETLARADQLAREQDRSRSWVIAEAIRQYGTWAAAPSVIREAQAPVYGYESGLGQFRRSQLEADLRLTPEARVRAAEETARVDAVLRPAPRNQILSFDSYEAWLDWSQREGLVR